MTKRVLIISFSMPPSPDIGARRWVKFAKYLKYKGHLVKILAAHEHHPEMSQWRRDAETLAQDITFTEASYPRYLGINAKSLKEKIFYRLSLYYVKIRNRGNYYDKSNLWKRQLLKAAARIIETQGITNVICTIPPFKMAHHLLELKKQYPDVNFIVDYRDPWSNNKTAFGFTTLSGSRAQHEKLAEKRVVKGYDKIIAVSVEMKEHFMSFLNNEELDRKFVYIPNGFDTDDFLHVRQPAKAENKNCIKIIFAGTFYDRSLHVLEKLVDTVKALEATNPSRKGFLKFLFIGTLPLQAKLLIDANRDSFSFLGKKNLDEAYSLLAEADYCSLFLTDDLNYSLSTKFYEYLALEKPIISFSRERGQNAKFIEENGIGIGIDFSSMRELVGKLMKNEAILEFNPKLDHHQFDVKNLAEKLEDILI